MLARLVDRIANMCACRLVSRAWLSGEQPRLKKSGRGGCCSAEECSGSSPGALSRLTSLPAELEWPFSINRVLGSEFVQVLTLFKLHAKVVCTTIGPHGTMK